MRRAAIGLFVLCAALFVAPVGTQGGSYYSPCARASLDSNAPGTPAKITTAHGVGLNPDTCGAFASANDRPGEWIYRRLVSFTPPEWHVATDADIPDGAEVGVFDSSNVLGLFDNGCNQVLNLDFVLLDGTTDVANPIDPLPPGFADPLEPLSIKNTDGVPGAAEYWPSYLTVLAEQSGMDLSKLVARAVGINTEDGFPGSTNILNLLVFEPGSSIFRGMIVDPNLGYPTISILNDPTIRASANGVVSDFCAPNWNEYTLYDNVEGVPYRQNPGDGVYNFTTFSIPAPDAENDGVENVLDPCPYDPNLSGWNPRGILLLDQTPGDNDVDGLPEECDPDLAARSECAAANGVSGHDQDCDGWANRMDNCPLLHNQQQEDADGDGIGDICDRSMAPEGQHGAVCNVTIVTIGSGGDLPPDPSLLAPCNQFDDCECPEVGDAECDLDIDGVDLLLTMQLLVGIGDVPCPANAYVGCDQMLNTPDIVVVLRYLVLHELPGCTPQ